MQNWHPFSNNSPKKHPHIIPKDSASTSAGSSTVTLSISGSRCFCCLGAVGFLLLIGCANVSILLLARGTARQHELAIRSAIGASRWRIQRQLLTECVALSLCGAAGGIFLAYRSLPILVRWLPEYSFPHELVIAVNVPVLAFTVVIAILSGVLFGMAPAFHFSRPQIAQLMQSSSGDHRRRRGETHASDSRCRPDRADLLLLTSAGAAMNGFVRIIHAQLGYDPTIRCRWGFRCIRTPT